MTIKEILGKTCKDFIGENFYHNSRGELDKKICLGIQSDNDVQVAIDNKAVANLNVSPRCNGYFYINRESDETRCPQCLDYIYIANAANSKKKKTV